jgi:Arc/MetJ-type ribon-helix-helix transcriptional regulator
MVSFRVSEEEFRTLADVCLSQGFLSYSDLVRTAVQELLSNRAGGGPAVVQSAVENLTRRIESLDRNLKELISHSSLTAT